MERMKQGLKVLSLCDGMSGGQESLRQCGIPVSRYYASEIKEAAINVAQGNFPGTVQLGDMNDWKTWDIDWESIDLLLGGMPCQGFSIAGKKLDFADPRSRLFFVGIEILNYAKKHNPNIRFLFENVRMKREISDELDRCVGSGHVYINSGEFGAMVRKRYYWSNIKPEIPEKKDIRIKDAIDCSVPFGKDLRVILSKTAYGPTVSSDGIITINPRNKNGGQTWQRGRVYDIRGKCPTIQESMHEINITADHRTYRKLTVGELERMQGFPEGYTKSVSENQAGGLLGDGWNIQTINMFLGNI